MYLHLSLTLLQPDWNIRIIKMLDPSKHSLCYMWLLMAFISHRKTQKTYEFSLIHGFFDKFLNTFVVRQLDSAISRLFQMISWYAEYLISVDKAIFGIKPVKQALLLSRESLEQVSPIHREFAKLCIKAKCYQHALPIIETPVTSFRKTTSPMDIITYNYYRGILFLGL
jgi:hypothetical protein